MTTIIIVAALMIGGWIFFKRYAKALPAKRAAEEIARLEADLGDTLVESMKLEFHDKELDEKMKRLKMLWKIRDGIR